MCGLFDIVGPFVRMLDAEKAHDIAVKALRCGIVPHCDRAEDPVLKTRLWGLEFPNPVGLAAGFDKNAEVYNALLAQGFGFVEVGTVTPHPQPGNPKPRLFRLPADGAVINRMGFNNSGMVAAVRRLKGRRQGIVGVNLGKNKDTEDAVSDYVKGARALGIFADYLALNVSSPNTPGVRALQSRDQLSALLSEVRKVLDQQPEEKRPPLLLKVAPDLTDQDKADIAVVALDCGIDGLIATNTTISRPDGLGDARRAETGGLSGRPLFDSSTQVLFEMYRLTEGRLPIIGVGGIASGHDAYAKVRAGASLVQLYTALVYQGPGLIARINRQLVKLLKADGFSSLSEAVGADHR